MLLMIDNYDSFARNLMQYFGELGAAVRVVRKDAITLGEIAALAPERIVVSPGPCSPAEAGVSVPLIRVFGGRFHILGFCLGHQAIGAAYGGKITHAKTLMHGKTSPVEHINAGVFAGLPSPFSATRYHSPAIARSSLPDCLEVTSHGLDRRWREHGCAPQEAGGRGRAVSPRIHTHRARPPPAG